MRNFLTRFALTLAAAFAVVVSPGCETEIEGGRKMVVDGIFVEPAAWKAYTVDGSFDHLYVDIKMPEITEFILNRASFHTYLRYSDVGQNGEEISVQELEGIAKSKWRFVDGSWISYTETVCCTYSRENMRIEIYRSDFFDRPPTEKMWFRTVILY